MKCFFLLVAISSHFAPRVFSQTQMINQFLKNDYPSVKIATEKLTLHNPSRSYCVKKYNSCPPILDQLIDDERRTRAMIVNSNIDTCYSKAPKLESENEISNLANVFNNQSRSNTVQKLFQMDRFDFLGEYSHSVIQTCADEANDSKLEAIAKFYYNMARLNLGSAKISQDQIIISQLLNKKPPPCPPLGVLEYANKVCEKLKACANTNNLDEIADQIAEDEEDFETIERKLKALPKNCDHNSDCIKLKNNYNAIFFSLAQKNPWFLDDEFRKEKNQYFNKKRLIKYLEKLELNLENRQKSVLHAANCMHGSGSCKPDEMNDLVATMPILPEPETRTKNLSLVNKQINFQNCIIESTNERNKLSAMLNDSYLVGGVLVGTLAISAAFPPASVPLATGAVAFTAARGVRTLATARLGQLAVEIPNLSLDAYSTFQMVDEVKKNCFDKNYLFDYSEPTQEKTCQLGVGILSTKSRKYGECLLYAGLSGVSALTIAISAQRTSSLLSGHFKKPTGLTATDETAPGAETGSASINFDKVKNSSNLVQRADSEFPRPIQTPRVISGPTNQALDFESSFIPFLPDGIKLVQEKNAEGVNKLFFQTREQLSDGTWVRRSREFEMDEKTGAINMNNPGGSELFERLHHAMAGQGHLAFLDLASLGIVNKTFRGGGELGEQAGDLYIKGLSEAIIKHGGGKVVLGRNGGDEFVLLIKEADSKKVQEMLTKIRDDLRLNKDANPRQIFDREKQARSQAFESKPTSENIQKLMAMDRIHPDISIGSTQIGLTQSLRGDLSKLRELEFRNSLRVSEPQAAQMKIASKLQLGESASKYGSKEKPNKYPDRDFLAPVELPAKAEFWRFKSKTDQVPIESGLREVKTTQAEVLKVVGDSTLSRYVDELGHESIRVDRSITNSSGKSEVVSYEIPTRSGLLDGTHRESQKLIKSHFNDSKDGVLVMPKLPSLRYLNYFEGGTGVGDEMLSAVSEIIKRHTRHDDLSFKLNGADYLMSLSKKNAEGVKQIQHRINREILQDEKVIAILNREKEVIQAKLKEAYKKLNLSDIKTYTLKYKEIKAFNPQVVFQSINRSEVKPDTDFESIYKMFNQRFSSK